MKIKTKWLNENPNITYEICFWKIPVQGYIYDVLVFSPKVLPVIPSSIIFLHTNLFIKGPPYCNPFDSIRIPFFLNVTVPIFLSGKISIKIYFMFYHTYNIFFTFCVAIYVSLIYVTCTGEPVCSQWLLYKNLRKPQFLLTVFTNFIKHLMHYYGIFWTNL